MKNKTKKLNGLVSYRIGKKFCNIIVNGKRYNFTLDEVRGELPVISKKAEWLYDMKMHGIDKNWFDFDDFGADVAAECVRMYNYNCITRKTVRQFLQSKGLL